MTISDRLNKRLSEVRSSVRERRARVEQTGKALRERFNNFRDTFKVKAFQRVDEVFCIVMETMEAALSRFHRTTGEFNGLHHGLEEQPIVTSNDWVQ